MNKGIEMFPHLFAPLKTGNTIFKNHISAAPTGFTDGDAFDQISESELRYLERKAMGGAAVITVSEVKC